MPAWLGDPRGSKARLDRATEAPFCPQLRHAPLGQGTRTNSFAASRAMQGSRRHSPRDSLRNESRTRARSLGSARWMSKATPPSMPAPSNPNRARHHWLPHAQRAEGRHERRRAWEGARAACHLAREPAPLRRITV
jgi:hypothetical protein